MPGHQMLAVADLNCIGHRVRVVWRRQAIEGNANALELKAIEIVCFQPGIDRWLGQAQDERIRSWIERERRFL